MEQRFLGKEKRLSLTQAEDFTGLKVKDAQVRKFTPFGFEFSLFGPEFTPSYHVSLPFLL
jgi:hypothetical protein